MGGAIVDLAAHQGNGHERDFMGDEAVFILDMYVWMLKMPLIQRTLPHPVLHKAATQL